MNECSKNHAFETDRSKTSSPCQVEIMTVRLSAHPMPPPTTNRPGRPSRAVLVKGKKRKRRGKRNLPICKQGISWISIVHAKLSSSSFRRGPSTHPPSYRSPGSSPHRRRKKHARLANQPRTPTIEKSNQSKPATRTPIIAPPPLVRPSRVLSNSFPCPDGTRAPYASLPYHHVRPSVLLAPVGRFPSVDRSIGWLRATVPPTQVT